MVSIGPIVVGLGSDDGSDFRPEVGSVTVVLVNGEGRFGGWWLGLDRGDGRWCSQAAAGGPIVSWVGWLLRVVFLVRVTEHGAGQPWSTGQRRVNIGDRFRVSGLETVRSTAGQPQSTVSDLVNTVKGSGPVSV